jgi:lipooligosaccharide transport system permease protein
MTTLATETKAGPRPGPSAMPVLEHLLVQYARTWRGSVLATFLVPVLFLLGMGLSVGAYVDRSGVLGMPYVDYIAPGLLASTVLQLAINESTWPVLGSFEWRRMYFAMQASPLRPRDIVAGQELFILLRAATATGGFLAAMALFATLHSWWTPLVVPICLLLAAATSLPVMAFSATIKSDNMFALIYRFAVIPMTLFAGVFFPVSAMPAVVRWLAYLSPLWHGVELCRAVTLGWPVTAAPIVHVLYLGVWAAGGMALARRQFVRRLRDGGS